MLATGTGWVVVCFYLLVFLSGFSSFFPIMLRDSSIRYQHYGLCRKATGIYTDRQKIPVREFLNVVQYALSMIRCNGTFVLVKLTLYDKECKLSLVHMPTQYRVNVKLSSAISLLFMKCFMCFELHCFAHQINIKL